MIYQWRPGVRFKPDPQAIGDHIATLRERDGVTTASRLVADAEGETSPLHDLFEWDDGVAGHQYRLAQARKVLASLVAVPDQLPDHEPIRALVAIKHAQQERDYMPIAVALEHPGYRSQVLAEAWAQLERWKKKYEDVSELAQVVQAIDQLKRSA